jgi:hypothetical protein
MGGRHLDARASKADRRLAEALPRKAAVAPPQLVEAGGDARNGARRRPDRVVDDLVAERDADVLQHEIPLRSVEPRHGDEEVEELDLAARTVEPDGVAAARDPGHHRLGNAGCERRRDGRVGGRTALREYRETRMGSGRMAGRNPRGQTHVC